MSLTISLVDYGTRTNTEIELYRDEISVVADDIWKRAGCEAVLYQCNGETAASIVPTLKDALCHMATNERDYRRVLIGVQLYNGNIFGRAFEFLRHLLIVCQDNPHALIKSTL